MYLNLCIHRREQLVSTSLSEEYNRSLEPFWLSENLTSLAHTENTFSAEANEIIGCGTSSMILSSFLFNNVAMVFHLLYTKFCFLENLNEISSFPKLRINF